MIYIIGIGVEGKSSLSQRALKLIGDAGLLVGGRRHLASFPEFIRRKVIIGSNLEEIVKIIKNHSSLTTDHSPTVILATGDPNFFGIADFIIKKVGRELVEIIPNVSAMQEAFARIKESWNDARFLSVHGRSKGQGARGKGQEEIAIENIVDEIIKYSKVGIFTDPDNTPAKIAKALLNKDIDNYKAYVCEDLGTEKERITEGTLSNIARKRFSPLNVMILVRQRLEVRGKRQNHNLQPSAFSLQPPASNLSLPFGIPDSKFSHTKGMITKEEIRVIAVSKLKLKNDSIVWDVGAGCGSISIEAALLAGKGKVFAIEKEKSRAMHIEKNKRRFAISNLEIINGNAPDCLKELPMPDAVFIGGGGEDIGKILAVCSKKLTARGIIVVNAITLDTLKAATDFFKKSNWNSETVSVNIAKTKDIAKLQLFNAYNPIFITIGEKP